MDFQDVIRRRRMVRRYEPREAPALMVDQLVRNALRAPSAGFSQGWGFLVLDQPDDVARFRKVVTPADGAEQWFAATFDAPVIIVPCANKDAYLDRYAQPEKGHADRSDAWWPAPYWDIDTGFAALLTRRRGHPSPTLDRLLRAYLTSRPTPRGGTALRSNTVEGTLLNRRPGGTLDEAAPLRPMQQRQPPRMPLPLGKEG